MDLIRQNLAAKLGAENLKKIEAASVGIAGAGGLGSNCAVALVRSGFRKLTIVDVDIIEPGNLDRQFYFKDQIGMKKVDALKINLLRINPDLDLQMSSEKIDPQNIHTLFSKCTIVAECFDSAETKSMLVSELLPSGKLVVAASGLGGVGSSDNIQIHRIKENLIMIGDGQSDIRLVPAIAPRVQIAASKQADSILEYVIGSHTG